VQEVKRAVETDTLEAALKLAGPRHCGRPAEALPRLLDERLASALQQAIRSARRKHVRTNPNAMSARELREECGVRNLKELVTTTKATNDEDRGTEDN